MSLGRTSTFVDIFLKRDIAEGRLTETAAQELVDDFVIKLRIIHFLRTPEYNELFSGDPTWVTEALGGVGADGRPLVTRTSFRYLQTLYNLKRFYARVSLDTPGPVPRPGPAGPVATEHPERREGFPRWAYLSRKPCPPVAAGVLIAVG